MARVEMLTGANRIAEQAGVRETRQARVFFKYESVPTPPMQGQDHVIIREIEYAIIEEPLLTHLQYELFVQEVIPND